MAMQRCPTGEFPCPPSPCPPYLPPSCSTWPPASMTRHSLSTDGTCAPHHRLWGRGARCSSATRPADLPSWGSHQGAWGPAEPLRFTSAPFSCTRWPWVLSPLAPSDQVRACGSEGDSVQERDLDVKGRPRHCWKWGKTRTSLCVWARELHRLQVAWLRSS